MKAKCLFLVPAFVVILFQLSSGDMSSGLLGRWTFEWDQAGGTVFADSSGNDLTATAAGNGQMEYEGVGNAKYGTAIEPLSGEFLKVENNAILDDLSKGLTISVWTMRNDHHPSTDVLMSRPKSGTQDNYFVFQINSDNKLEFKIKAGDGDEVVVTSTADVPYRNGGNTHYTHCAVTYDNSVIKLYIDNVEVGSQEYTTVLDLSSETSPLLIYGVSTDGGATAHDTYFGRTDEARIYNRGLSADDIGLIFDWDGTTPPVSVTRSGAMSIVKMPFQARPYSVIILDRNSGTTGNQHLNLLGRQGGTAINSKAASAIYVARPEAREIGR